jgi:hypothetical protein
MTTTKNKELLSKEQYQRIFDTIYQKVVSTISTDDIKDNNIKVDDESKSKKKKTIQHFEALGKKYKSDIFCKKLF